MSFDFEQVFEGMLSIIEKNLLESGKSASSYGRHVLIQRETNFKTITQMYFDGQLTLKQYQSELDDEKTTLENQMLAEEVIVKSTAQKAINEAIDFLVSSLKSISIR